MFESKDADCEELAKKQVILYINGREVMQIHNALFIMQQFMHQYPDTAVCKDCKSAARRLTHDFEDQLEMLKELTEG